MSATERLDYCTICGAYWDCGGHLIRVLISDRKLIDADVGRLKAEWEDRYHDDRDLNWSD